MSHVSCVETVINDLDALEKAANECGLELVKGQTTYRWFGRWVNDYHAGDAAYHHGIDPSKYGQCDHALRIPGNSQAYEVGVVKMPDGTFRVVWDFFAGGHGLAERIGGKGEKLTQTYVKTRVTKELAKKGFKLVNAENLASGNLKLTLKGRVSL